MTQATRRKIRDVARTGISLFLVYVMALFPLIAQQGGTIKNGSAQGLLPDGSPTGLGPGFSGFRFELEGFAPTSLKTTPIFDELEQLMDYPYRITSTCTDAQGSVPPNEQGYTARCTNSQFERRPSFGVTLPPFLVHPYNYNPLTGGQMRLLNRHYQGTPFNIAQPGEPDNFVMISPGEDRVEDDEIAIDHNNPIRRDTYTCITLTEPPEGSTLCGGDPGEPVSSSPSQSYSEPALQTSSLQPISPSSLAIGRLWDPVRGFIEPMDANGNGGLRKPSLRKPDAGGSPAFPSFHTNIDANDTTPSNENDYLQVVNAQGQVSAARKNASRRVAMALGKALFWDMQVGSDGVQSCGSCHFHAGADNRTKNQMNPNHLSGDTVFTVKQPNQDLVKSDFPFHKLTNPEIAGDPRCTTPITARVNPGVLENFPNGVTRVVCSAGNIIRSTNDVASSMGVKFGKFRDILVGAAGFTLPSMGVSSLMPDLRSANPVENVDPIPGFAGNDGSGHQFRRVEPRNTPTLFLSGQNFDNFWDGRARHDFNGGSVFGPSDPQLHVYVTDTRFGGDPTGFSGRGLTATRQLIRLASLGSLATGPALSDFEMSFAGRNWAKIGKKLLQPGVTPLANQLVDPNDSILGPFSNQPGNPAPSTVCTAAAIAARATGKPGLCASYSALIQASFHRDLWANNGQMHLNGAVCNDPFDGYCLTIAAGPADPLNTNQFTQMEANFSLFFGMGVHLWAAILMPDDTPFDKFSDKNPDLPFSIGEANEPGLVGDFPLCTSSTQRDCLNEVGNFKRDPGLIGFMRNNLGAAVPFVSPGSRTPGSVDPLLGLDIFQGSNLSLKNPNFRTGRCAECHAGSTFTDHTINISHGTELGDFATEFRVPGIELLIEPIGRTQVVGGFMLEEELSEAAQDGVERRIINQSIAPNPADGLAWPDGLLNPLGADGIAGTADDFRGTGSAFFDNGMYNLGVTPCEANQTQVTGRCDDIGRGGDDPFGWPLSLAVLALKNLGGPGQQPGQPLPNFNPGIDPDDPDCDEGGECSAGGLFEETAQDEHINPGFEGEPENPLMPPYMARFLNNINSGEGHPVADELFGGVNTLTDVAILEGFEDTLGPFNPAAIVTESLNSAIGHLMGTWPVVNRVGRMGSFKAAGLREVELTGPYFHNGGKLTLRQVVDFYTRGGDFPVTNAEHRDFNMVNMSIELQSNLTEEEKVALVDFLLELTDDRVRYERAPFDHPEVFVPLDGTAPENTFGRSGFLANIANGMFRQVPAVGAGGSAAPLPNFLGISSGPRLVGAAAFCGDEPNNHYCR
jgi:hypothetical protein